MSLLLKSEKIGTLNLKNRIIMPPMCMYKSDNSRELNIFHKYNYTSKALGGVGFIIVEATAIEPRGRISDNDLGLWCDEQIEKHIELNIDCHFFGAKMAIKLAHAGRKSTSIYLTPIAPSAIRAKKANYDAIELHAAHGYLLCEFLSPLTNKRDDIYGGSL